MQGLIRQALLQLENPGKQTRELEAVSFLELAQGARQDDEAHPNFRDLSIQVSPLGGAGLLSRRLPRDGRDRAPLIAHFVGGDVCSLRRQGDRVLFLGRTGDYAAPEQMRRAPGECDFRTGDVIAPCLSLRAGVRVSAGGKAALCFFTAAGESEAALSALPCGLDAAREALSLSAARARMTLRFLHIDGAMLALYQNSVQAKSFTSAMTYEILLIVVIGGIGSVTGSCLSSFLFVACSEWWLRFLDQKQMIGTWEVPLLRNGFRLVVFSIIIMIVVLFFRQGIMGTRELPDLFRKQTEKAQKGGAVK